MPNVKINCPICDKKGIIEISQDVMKNVSRGLLAVNIAEGIVLNCSHSFVAYIDKNFNVRDYFTADFQIEIPEITPTEKIQASKIPTKEVLDIDLIRLNISSILLTYILKSIFSKQKIVLLSNQQFLYGYILNFFKYITQDAFKVDLTIMTAEDFENRKKELKDAIVFENNNIIKNNKNLINPKKLLIESGIVGKFLKETDLGFGYIILKNEIQKAYGLAKSIVDVIDDEKKKGEKVNILKIQTELEKKYGVKINTLYLKFLIDIVINYFGISVPSLLDGFFNFL